MQRMKTMLFIQIMPFSGPLLLYYLYTYPNKIPSWFCIDSIFEEYQEKCMQRQLEMVEHFKAHPLTTDNFSLAGMSITELKQLSELLYGHYDDGVVGINKFMKNNPKQYMLHPHLSKHIVKRTIRK